ncbi:MAG TPA: M48 family metalloprotease [Vicinamibacterales bacterium]|nr:M48 family metalloprotease [Vicinamibacterales bacterium]
MRSWVGRLKPATTCLLLLAAACATNPATGERQLSFMSEEKEIALGQENDAQVRKEMGSYDDRALQEYVTSIGLKLAQVSERPALPWHFTVADVPAVNAFALPGGYIYITRGILPYLDDESQLAGVLGHEIGHVTARHAASQYSKSTLSQIGLIGAAIFAPGGPAIAEAGGSGLGLLLLKNSRDDEAQADGLGVRYASRAGWDPAGIPRMLTTLGRIEEASDSKGVPNWLQTHPQPDDRVQRVQAAVREAEAGATKFVENHDAYLQRMKGLVWGDNPEQGIVRGSSFLHKGLRFSFEFPAGWSIENGSTAVVAKQPGTNDLMLLQQVRRPARTVEDTAIITMQNAGFRAVEGAPRSVNGLDGYVGSYVGVLQNYGRVQLRALFVRNNQDTYLVAGIAPIDAYPNVVSTFDRSLDSFRSMSPADAERLQPNRIDLYTAKQGDTWQSIAERQSKGIIKATTLAIMNGHPVNDQPPPGERLKIVVGD